MSNVGQMSLEFTFGSKLAAYMYIVCVDRYAVMYPLNPRFDGKSAKKQVHKANPQQWGQFTSLSQPLTYRNGCRLTSKEQIVLCLLVPAGRKLH